MQYLRQRENNKELIPNEFRDNTGRTNEYIMLIESRWREAQGNV